CTGCVRPARGHPSTAPPSMAITSRRCIPDTLGLRRCYHIARSSDWFAWRRTPQSPARLILRHHAGEGHPSNIPSPRLFDRVPRKCGAQGDLCRTMIRDAGSPIKGWVHPLYGRATPTLTRLSGMGATITGLVAEQQERRREETLTDLVQARRSFPRGHSE